MEKYGGLIIMRGIEKSKFIDAIRRAKIDIVLDIDIEDLFCDLGEECTYNADGIPEFVNQDKSVNEEIQKEIAALHFTKQDILYGIGNILETQKVHRFGPGIICYACPKCETCNKRCERYLLAKKEYEEWLDKVEELGHPPVESVFRKII